MRDTWRDNIRRRSGYIARTAAAGPVTVRNWARDLAYPYRSTETKHAEGANRGRARSWRSGTAWWVRSGRLVPI